MCIRDRIVAAGEDVITKHIIDAMPDCPSVKKLVSVGPVSYTHLDVYKRQALTVGGLIVWKRLRCQMLKL